MPDKNLLTREALLNGDIDRLLHHSRSGSKVMSDEQRAELVRVTLEQLTENVELWVFGYGSLIWNPALDFEDQRCCSIKGFQRKFCFWTTMSRGTEEQPGLMMGLVEGGRCDGVAYKIGREKAETELDILFRREMFTYVYKPTWIEAHCVETDTSFTTLTFVVDTASERYVDNLSQEERVEILATAQGPLGRNCDYLFELSKRLRELDLEDSELNELEQLIINYQVTQSKNN